MFDHVRIYLSLLGNKINLHSRKFYWNFGVLFWSWASSRLLDTASQVSTIFLVVLAQYLTHELVLELLQHKHFALSLKMLYFLESQAESFHCKFYFSTRAHRREKLCNVITVKVFEMNPRSPRTFLCQVLCASI